MLVRVLPYQEDWPSHFEFIANGLREALSEFLPEGSFRIEHVGSTSIPGLAAKPIIDIDIIVPAELIMEATMALTAHGYTYAYEANGIDRMVFRWNKHALDSGASKPTEDGEPRRAVYLNKEGGAAQLNHMAVKRTLLSDTELRDRYGAAKLALSGQEYQGIGDYGGRKDPVVQEILQRSGLSQDELNYIRNRPRRKIDKVLMEQKRAAEKAKMDMARQQEMAAYGTAGKIAVAA